PDRGHPDDATVRLVSSQRGEDSFLLIHSSDSVPVDASVLSKCSFEAAMIRGTKCSESNTSRAQIAAREIIQAAIFVAKETEPSRGASEPQWTPRRTRRDPAGA